MGVKFGVEDLYAKFHPWRTSTPNFTPIGAACRPWGAKKPQNRPLSKLNTGRFALRPMLPVKNSTFLATLAAGEIRAPPNLAW